MFNKMTNAAGAGKKLSILFLGFDLWLYFVFVYILPSANMYFR